MDIVFVKLNDFVVNTDAITQIELLLSDYVDAGENTKHVEHATIYFRDGRTKEISEELYRKLERAVSFINKVVTA